MMRESRPRHDGATASRDDAAPTSADDHAPAASDECASATADERVSATADHAAPGPLSQRLVRYDRHTGGEGQHGTSDYQALTCHLPLLAYMDGLSVRVCTWHRQVGPGPDPDEMRRPDDPSNKMNQQMERRVPHALARWKAGDLGCSGPDARLRDDSRREGRPGG